MYEIDPTRTDLAEEFKSDPFGRHSPELQLVLNRMRFERVKGRYILVKTAPSEYTLAQLTGVRGDPPQLIPEHAFDNLEDAEWVVFKLRWKKLTGEELSID